MLLNGIRAMHKGGTLKISVKKRAGEACVTITDTGEGIKKSDIDKIFDPFFTTKATGKGTGLGLSTAYGVVRQIRGDILVESKLGEGSTFNVLLPVVEPVSVAEMCTSTAAMSLIDHKKKILVVEDDASVRKILAEVLAAFPSAAK